MIAAAITIVLMVLAVGVVIWISPRRSGHGAGTDPHAGGGIGAAGDGGGGGDGGC